MPPAAGSSSVGPSASAGWMSSSPTCAGVRADGGITTLAAETPRIDGGLVVSSCFATGRGMVIGALGTLGALCIGALGMPCVLCMRGILGTLPTLPLNAF